MLINYGDDFEVVDTPLNKATSLTVLCHVSGRLDWAMNRIRRNKNDI